MLMLENSVDVDPDFINDFDCGPFKFFMQLFEGDLPHQVVQGQKQTGVFRGLLIPQVQCLGHWTLFESSQTNGLPEWLLQRLELLFCLRSLGIDLGDNVIDILDPGLPLVFMLHFVDDVKDELLDALGLQTVGGDDDFIRLVLFDVLLELVLFVFVVGLEGGLQLFFQGAHELEGHVIDQFSVGVQEDGGELHGPLLHDYGADACFPLTGVGGQFLGGGILDLGGGRHEQLLELVAAVGDHVALRFFNELLAELLVQIGIHEVGQVFFDDIRTKQVPLFDQVLLVLRHGEFLGSDVELDELPEDFILVLSVGFLLFEILLPGELEPDLDEILLFCLHHFQEGFVSELP